MRTLKELEKALVQERKLAQKSGMFGLEECKKSIKEKMENGKTLFEIYTELVVRGMKESFFNLTMIVACEQMLEEIK